MPRRHTVSTPYHQRVTAAHQISRIVQPQKPSKHGRRQSLSDLTTPVLPSDSELKEMAPAGNFEQMTREQLIERLVQLEKQKRSGKPIFRQRNTTKPAMSYFSLNITLMFFLSFFLGMVKPI